MSYKQTPAEYTKSVHMRFWVMIKALLGHYGGVSFKQWLDEKDAE